MKRPQQSHSSIFLKFFIFYFSLFRLVRVRRFTEDVSFFHRIACNIVPCSSHRHIFFYFSFFCPFHSNVIRLAQTHTHTSPTIRPLCRAHTVAAAATTLSPTTRIYCILILIFVSRSDFNNLFSMDRSKVCLNDVPRSIFIVLHHPLSYTSKK